MGSHVHRHPDEVDLLRFVDGELPARRAHEVRSHLETCWECRTALQELQSSVADTVRYRKELFGRLPSPPAPWMDIYTGLARMDAATGRASFLEALLRPRWMYRWLLPATLALAALFIGFLKLQQTPSVQAAEILRKAVASEQSKPARTRRIRVRTSSRTLLRPAVQRDADPDLRALFASAEYSFVDPLSAGAYRDWRARLRDGHDEVHALGTGGYLLRTQTNSGPLASASLTLSSPDFRAVESRLEFRNREWVEMAEVPADLQVETPPQAPVATAPIASPPAHASAIAAPDLPQPVAATAADQLQVIAALHRLGADLGDPVEVSRSGNVVVVSGVGITPQRQQQIRQAVDALPHVVVRFSDAASAPESGAPPQSIDAAPNSDDLQFQGRVEQQLGGRAGFERFSSQLVDLNEAVMARAYALRRVAQQFPADAEPALNPEDRRTLIAMLREHADVLSRTQLELQQLLNPVLVGLGGQSGEVKQKVSAPRGWQAATEDLFQDARGVETLIAAMLDGSHKTGLEQNLPSQLLTALAQLHLSVENYKGLLLLEPGGAGK